MTTKVYIPSLWTDDGQLDVTALINSATAAATAGLLKVDGTRSMQGNLNLDNNEIHNLKLLKPVAGGDIDLDGSFNMKNYNLLNIQGLSPMTTLKLNGPVDMFGDIDLRDRYEILNPKIPQSDNSLARFKEVRHNYSLIDEIYVKHTTNMFPVPNQVVTASSHWLPWGSKSAPEHVFDNNFKTQWVTGTGGQRSWVQVELPSKVQIWKVRFHPRTGHQQTTQLFTHYWFEGSVDGNTYERILESHDQIDQVREFTLNVTKPFKFFKFTGDGISTMGLTGIEMFEATLLKQSDIDDSISTLPKVVLPSVASQGNIPWLTVDNNGNPILSSSLNLKLDDQGLLSTHSGDIKFGRNINMNFNRIKKLDTPINPNDAVTKGYVDGRFLSVSGANKMQSNLDMNNYNIVNTKDPVNNSDVVTKSYLITNTVSQTVYDSNLALPGIPVTSGLTTCFIPTLDSCTVTQTGHVTSFKNMFSSLTLQGTSGPKMNVSQDNLYYLYFDGTKELKGEMYLQLILQDLVEILQHSFL